MQQTMFARIKSGHSSPFKDSEKDRGLRDEQLDINHCQLAHVRNLFLARGVPLLIPVLRNRILLKGPPVISVLAKPSI